MEAPRRPLRLPELWKLVIGGGLCVADNLGNYGVHVRFVVGGVNRGSWVSWFELKLDVVEVRLVHVGSCHVWPQH